MAMTVPRDIQLRRVQAISAAETQKPIIIILSLEYKSWYLRIRICNDRTRLYLFGWLEGESLIRVLLDTTLYLLAGGRQTSGSTRLHCVSGRPSRNGLESLDFVKEALFWSNFSVKAII